MEKFDVIPLHGVPPIELGMSRQESREAMAQPANSYRKSTDETLTDTYHESCFQVFFDSEERVEYIELSAPINAVFKGVIVFQTLAGEMSATVASDSPCDPNDPEFGYSYTFPALEMSLWRPTIPEEDQRDDDPDGRYFSTIGVGKHGYYSGTPLPK